MATLALSLVSNGFLPVKNDFNFSIRQAMFSKNGSGLSGRSFLTKTICNGILSFLKAQCIAVYNKTLFTDITFQQ